MTAPTRLQALPLPAFSDNYIWLLRPEDSNRIVIVDPGAAGPVIGCLETEDLELAAILITHHHWDHTSGLSELLAYHAVPVHGPASLHIPLIDHPAGDGQTIRPLPDLVFEVMAVPGHTLDHLAYYGGGIVLSGDTLFAAGCGRLFEGSPKVMYQSLQRLAALPAETRVCCAHEYTLSNLEFGHLIEPSNTAITHRLEHVRALRAADRPSLPSTIREERLTNPFLRCDEPEVIATAEAYAGHRLEGPIEVFATLRAWKNLF